MLFLLKLRSFIYEKYCNIYNACYEFNVFNGLGIAEDSKAELNQKRQTILETMNHLENKGYITNKMHWMQKEFVYDEITLLRENKNTEEIKNSQESNIEVSFLNILILLMHLKLFSVLAF